MGFLSYCVKMMKDAQSGICNKHGSEPAKLKPEDKAIEVKQVAAAVQPVVLAAQPVVEAAHEVKVVQEQPAMLGTEALKEARVNTKPLREVVVVHGRAVAAHDMVAKQLQEGVPPRAAEAVPQAVSVFIRNVTMSASDIEKCCNATERFLCQKTSNGTCGIPAVLQPSLED
ncbi:unnamed protein product [Cladocopium goreaui]|uniref:Uncharacterized protein n=1 Tax=Cladocopium goreaui TaxID=2562237 RepID=A0A9P1D0K8_9DINO|nr:unnamed protein product [Cladocopium goreaui]